MYDFDLSSALNSLNQITGNITSTAMGIAGSKHLQKLAYQQQKEINTTAFNRQKELMELQRGWNIEDYDKILNDTSPEAAVQRFKAAGLSSAAAAQAAGDITPTQNPTSLGSVPSSSAPSYPSMSPFNIDILGSMRQAMALRKEKVEAENMEATQISDIKGVLDVNEAKNVALQAAWESLRFTLETNPYSSRSMYYKSLGDQHFPELQKLAVETAEQNLKTAREMYDYLVNVHPKELKKLDEEIKEIQESVKKLHQDINTGRSQEVLNYANVGVANATEQNINKNTEVQEEQRKGTILSNYTKVIDNAVKKWGASESQVQSVNALVQEGLIQPTQITAYFNLISQYTKTGYDTFKGDNDLRNVFIHQLVPGLGEADKVPVWSHGTLYRPFRELRDNPSHLNPLINLRGH